jgi:Domain of unknown function (DUF397)
LAEFDEQSITWRKSTASAGGSCLEAADHDGLVLVRDSMNPDGVLLSLTPAAWCAFLTDIRVVRRTSDG